MGSRAFAACSACLLWLAADATAAEPAPGDAPVQATIEPPRLISSPDVPYPEGAEGGATVVLTLLVAATGEVLSATPLAEHEPFSSHAARAALAFRFEPAVRGETPVAAKIRMQLVFHEPQVELGPAPLPDRPPPAETLTDATAVEEETPSEVEVQGVRPEPSRTVTFSRAEVRQIPGTFGDPFRAIEGLPGVTPIVSGLPFFFVRGAPPGNVGYFLDGLRVPLLFHVGAGPSVVHPALIERVDLYPGGYPARYGRFAGGIVTGEIVPPADELHGEYNLRIFDAGLLVESPFAGGRATALVGGRYSYSAALLSLLSPETILDYWDYQARATVDLSPEDRASVLAFGSYDFLGQKTPTQTLTLFGAEFHRVDFRNDHRIGGHGNLRTGVTLGLDRSTFQRQERSVRSRLLDLRTELTERASDAVLLRAGTDLEFTEYDVELGTLDLSPTAARLARLFASRTDVALGGYADAVLSVTDGFDVTPGARVDLYASEGATAVAVEPRLGVRARAAKGVHVLVALGIAHQPPGFVVPVPGFRPAGLEGGLQKAIQESLGLEVNLGDATTFTSTITQNAFFDMSDPLGVAPPELLGCPPGSFPSDVLSGDPGRQPDEGPPCVPRFAPGVLGPDRSGGGGQAADGRLGVRAGAAFEVRTMGSSYGLELLLKRKLTSRFGGFVSYTLSRSTRSYGSRRYVASFDRTHVANVAAAYDLGRRWRAGARTLFYTGLPKAPDPTDPSATRLPPFFRLDLRLEKRWLVGKTAFISAVAEWMNATLSKEAIASRCTLQGCEAEMIGPITIPSLGVEGGF